MYTKTSFFGTRLAFVLFRAKEPRHLETILTGKSYLYLRTRLLQEEYFSDMFFLST